MDANNVKPLALAAGAGAAVGALLVWLAQPRQPQQPQQAAAQEEAPAPSEPLPDPLDLRLGVTKPIGTGQIRWCVLGTGRVAHDFTQALKSVPGAVLSVVAARAPSRLASAQKFADSHGFATAVGSYADALARDDVDVVYLSAVHQYRVQHVEMILNAGKPVLVEKPFACNSEDAARLVALAREKNLFIMEGMWTRFFPAVEKARQLIEEGTIGRVVSVLSDFSFNAADSGKYPEKSFPDLESSDGDPIYHQRLGGGSLLWAGPYPLAAGVLPFGKQKPTRIAAAGVLDPHSQVDLSFALSLSYAEAGGPAGEPVPAGTCPSRGASVSLMAGIDGEGNETTTYVGTKGRVTIQTPSHCPVRVVLETKGKGRGAGERVEYDFPLPPLPPAALAAPVSPDMSEYFNYPNSNGFQYEAAAVQRCLLAGLKECPQYPNDEMLQVMQLIDETKAQIAQTS